MRLPRLLVRTWPMALAALLPITSGCASRQSFTRGIEEPARMEEVILKAIPVGTPLPEAQRFMESEGFSCFADKNRDGTEILWGDRQNATKKFLINQRWQIKIRHESGKVAEVKAHVGLIGL
jgi:hypothetical protein